METENSRTHNRFSETITVRRRTDRGLPDVGIILPEAPNTVVRLNVWELPMTEERFAQQPREVFPNPLALITAGWGLD